MKKAQLTLNQVTVKPELLAKARAASGLSQAEAGRRAGVTRATVWAYENGQGKPSGEVLARLIILYGVSVEYLTGITNEQVIFFRQNV